MCNGCICFKKCHKVCSKLQRENITTCGSTVCGGGPPCCSGALCFCNMIGRLERGFLLSLGRWWWGWWWWCWWLCSCRRYCFSYHLPSSPWRQVYLPGKDSRSHDPEESLIWGSELTTWRPVCWPDPRSGPGLLKVRTTLRKLGKDKH